MTLLHKIKRIFQHLVVSSRRKATNYDPILKSAFEKESLRICRNLIHCPEAELLVCPDTGRRFIIYNPMQIKIILEDNKITISNHTYYYEVSICSKNIGSVTRIFDGNVRERRDVLEEDIKENAKITLANIAVLSENAKLFRL